MERDSIFQELVMNHIEAAKLMEMKEFYECNTRNIGNDNLYIFRRN